MSGRVLVLDDDPALVEHLVERLTAAGVDARGEVDPARALDRVALEGVDLLVTDVEMPTLRGPDVLAALRVRSPSTLVVVMTAFGSIELAVQCLREGAVDFLAKPFPFDLLKRAIDRALGERALRREVVRLRATRVEAGPAGIRTQSESMRRVIDVCARAARADVPVLLTGESGVGKTHLARFVHASSPRAARPFVHVNCATLPANLVEAELFGARRGAFTDAHRDRIGRFQEAQGGTLLLDEVGELPLELQPKLLQVLDSGAFRPVGAERDLRVDVRLVAATNQDLRVAIAEGRFREDLYYRLHVVSVEVPPLRERPEDILPLVDGLLQATCERLGRPIAGISQQATRWLLSHRWPGNVRELANRIERAVVLAEHDTLVLEDFDPPAPGLGAAATELFDGLARAGWPLADVQAAYVDAVMAANGGNKAKAARQLGVDRRTLYRWAEVDGSEED